MKCLILAGGKGNSLWPLSREEYPKQFMEVKENRSLLQETVARNIPFCDEFLIVTNASYHFIVEGQMNAFQGLRYRCILEEEGRKTGPAIALACLCLNPSELVYVVSADQIIEGEAYKETVMRGRKLAREGKLVTFGMLPVSPHTGYGYIRHEGEKVIEFKEKPDAETAQKYCGSGEYLWNSGNFLFQADVFLNELRLCSPDIYHACVRGGRQLPTGNRVIFLRQALMQSIPAVSVERAVFEKSKQVYVVEAAFHWWDIGDLEILSTYLKGNNDRRVLTEACENVTVINRSDQQLVVASHLEDVTIVNMDDVCYVTRKSAASDIKRIILDHPEYGHYFEKSNLIYRPWGTYEILNYTENYKVKKVKVYPGQSLTKHRHRQRSEQWSVVQGTATVTLDEVTRDYPVYSSVTVPIGAVHTLANNGDEDLIIMEVSLGPQVMEEDKEGVVPAAVKKHVAQQIVKCEPIFKDSLWGGTKLRDIYGKKCDYEVIAESWELSAHENGQCRIAEGKYKGMLFGEYLNLIGEEALGWKCQAFEKFPLLIKFIDAKDTLSVQVHPSDDYALPNENEYGKNELWYVMDCEENACLYYGLKREITREELSRRIEDNTILEVLNCVHVKKGDTFFVNAGTIHAIGAGILICEIQQNSNCTYRLYDYDRRDKFGNARELHLEKAMAVADLHSIEEIKKEQTEPIRHEGWEERLLGECKYFRSTLFRVDSDVEIMVDDASFCAVVILEGKGCIGIADESLDFAPADTFFVHAGKKKVCVQGKCEFILTRL